ncbi:MAG: radical SAM protein, partial [Bacteriovoracia bacterium]
MDSSMIDDYGRKMKKLRVSLLDACNFRCTYCMPASATFSKVHDLLTADETGLIVSNLAKLGIEEVRLTGGEPTLRAELVDIV